MTVSLVEIFAAARAHAAPLAAESAGYLLLGVADHVVSAPRVVEADEVELSSDGGVRVRPRRGAAGNSEGAEANVRRLLGRALALSSSVGPALRRAAERREDVGLAQLVRELEVALIPVNRAAAKRALSRLYRETERARDAGKLERLLQAEAEAPAVASPPPEVLLASADFPEPSPAALPAPPAPPPEVVPVAPSPRRAAPAPVVELTLTPEPQLAVGEPALTKPEPAVLRARERGGSTPQLGTVVTAQTLPGEELELTERAPLVVEEELEVAPEMDVAPELPAEVEVAVDVAVELEAELQSPDEVTPVLAPVQVAEVEPAPQPLSDPEPSLLPDVLSAMVELHTGLDSDEVPTRLRDVVTALCPEESAPELPELELALEEASLAFEEPPLAIEDVWLTPSSLEGVESAPAPTLFVSERVAPEVHEALTWDPGPVMVTLPETPPTPLVLAEPAPEPSPYAPAVLPARSSEVSELLDSFYVSGEAGETELRSALKEMAGLELTPRPQALVDER